MQLTQIINGQVTELILCEACARQRGLFDPQSLAFAEQFFPEELKKKVEEVIRELTTDGVKARPGAAEYDESADSLTRCPVCDFSLADYRKSNRFGCPDCYHIFTAEHAATEQNVTPAQSEASVSPALQRKQLEAKMQAAIESEDYETAAIIRDQLKQLS